MSTPQRIEIVLKNPNPVFEKWLETWRQEAERKGSKSQHTIRRALDSLRSFPLPLMTGKDCGILRGFGPTLCNLIDQELEMLKKLHPSSIATHAAYQNDVMEVARSVQKEKKLKQSKLKLKSKKLTFEKVQLNDEVEQIIMSPGMFEILLLVDVQETNGRVKKTVDKTRQYLEDFKIPHEIRRLTVGDFAWICRDNQNNELVLPYIVERKRMDDLASSIRDGRFHEQKFRLKSCKVQNLIYLIEDHGNNNHISLNLEILLQSATNTQVQDRFQVKYTKNNWESILYLKVLTTTIIKLYKDKLLIGTSKEDIQPCGVNDPTVGLLRFKDFYDDSARNSGLTVRDIFIKQLVQLHSLSIERALAIVQIYPTPRSLLNAYDLCSCEEEARNMLAFIKCGKLERPLGATISRIVHDFYRSDF